MNLHVHNFFMKQCILKHNIQKCLAKCGFRCNQQPKSGVFPCFVTFSFPLLIPRLV